MVHMQHGIATSADMRLRTGDRCHGCTGELPSARVCDRWVLSARRGGMTCHRWRNAKMRTEGAERALHMRGTVRVSSGYSARGPGTARQLGHKGGRFEPPLFERRRGNLTVPRQPVGLWVCAPPPNPAKQGD
jgi:hypothetical protein